MNIPVNCLGCGVALNIITLKFEASGTKVKVKFAPIKNIRQSKIPIHANVSKAVQVIATENMGSWQKLRQRAGNKNSEVEEIPGFNHLFQKSTTSSSIECRTSEQPISPTVSALMKN